MTTTTAPTTGWSTILNVPVGAPGQQPLVTLTPGSGGSIVAQWSNDRVIWSAFGPFPSTLTTTEGIGPPAYYVRAMGIGAAGSVAVSLTSDTSSPMSGTQAAQAFGGGTVAALFGDSMTDWNFNAFTATSASFDPTTNIMTFTVSSHNTMIGSSYGLYNRTYTSLYNLIHLTVLSITSSSVFTVLMPGTIGVTYNDLPNGTLLGNSNLSNFLFKCSKGWLNWLNLMLNQRIPIYINSAQPGDKIFENIRRLPGEMALWKAGGVNLIVMQCPGINDCTPSATSQDNSVVQMWIGLEYLLDTIRLNGFRIIISTVTPVAASEANRANVTSMTLAYDLARWLRNYGIRYSQQVLVLDLYKTFINPTDATGLARAGYCASSDHIHGTNVGMYRGARDMKTAVAAFLPSYVDSLPVNINDSRNASKVTVTTKTIDDLGMVTITGAGSNMCRDQEIFVTGATGVYGPTAQSGVNGKQMVVSTDSTASFRFQTSITGQAGTITGTLVISSSRQLFLDPLLQTTTGGTANAGGTLTATKIAGQLAVTLTDTGSAGDIVATADVSAEAGGWGNEQTLVVSTAINGTNARISWKNTTTHVNSYMIPGRTYVMEAQIRYTTAADWVNNTIGRFVFFAQPTVTSPQSETWIAYDSYDPSSDSSITLFQSGDALTQTYHVRTSPITVPAGYVIASWNMNFYTYFIGTLLENLTIGISRIAVRDITADGPELLQIGA